MKTSLPRLAKLVSLSKPGGSTTTPTGLIKPWKTVPPRNSLQGYKSDYRSSYPRHNFGMHVTWGFPKDGETPG
jgi:hypothetical protein